MKEKTSADYQREFRKRLRESGLVKKEVWILPENAKKLSAVEKQLRIDVKLGKPEGEYIVMNESTQWTSDSLLAALQKDALCASGMASIELIDGLQPTLYVVMKEYGDLPIFISVADEQIIAESMLWPLSAVADVAGFNDAVLRTHKYFPLSTISLEQTPGGDDYYYMFGALSSSSILSNIVYELEALASNVIQSTTAYAEYISVLKEAK